jgi:uncharacterized membrane protein
MFRTTLIGGVLFLLPIVIVLLLLGKAWQVSMAVAEPIAAALPLPGAGAVIAVEAAAVLLLVLICYLAGLVAARAAMRRRFASLDGALMEMLPPYAFVKTMVGSMAQAEGEAGVLRPVAVKFDDYTQLALEVERDGAQVVIYLPGSPSPWSGATMIVEAGRVTALPIASHEMIRTVRLLGRGSLAALRRAAPG